jgi:hypothetical protein
MLLDTCGMRNLVPRGGETNFTNVNLVLTHRLKSSYSTPFSVRRPTAKDKMSEHMHSSKAMVEGTQT